MERRLRADTHVRSALRCALVALLSCAALLAGASAAVAQDCEEGAVDTDGDGVCDLIDNCVDVPNPDQGNNDGLSFNCGDPDTCEAETQCDFFRNGSHVYLICTNRELLSWFDAREYCESLGDELIRIDSQEEDELIYSMLGEIFFGAWMGYFDTAEEGTFVWLDNVRRAYTNWGPNQPTQDPFQDCVRWTSDGTWDDHLCSARAGFVCEGRTDDFGDACDTDDDNDGIPDDQDNCPFLADRDQTDLDMDGIGDPCDDDDDNDGFLDGIDNCPRVNNPRQTNTDQGQFTCGDTPQLCTFETGCVVNYIGLDEYLVCTTDQLERSWPEARAFCQEYGGDLVQIESAEENVRVAEMLVRRFQEPSRAWMGYTDVDEEGIFSWVDGNDRPFSYWANRQPDDGEGNQDCAHWTDLSQWADGDCSDARGFVCEEYSDNRGDACDTDDDDDTISDISDNCPLVPNTDQADANGDGIGDACDGDTDGDGVPNGEDNCPERANPGQANEDGDEYGDVCEPDTDRDSIIDDEDNCPGTYNPDQDDADNDGEGDVCSDRDEDGIVNRLDNCPEIPNDDQLDSDEDMIGDACDEDDDDDTVLDEDDNCPLVANTDQANADGADDGGDACDEDDDDDTVVDDEDNCPLVANTDQLNTDGDAQGDACDEDDDDDTVVDDEDNCPLDANTDQANADGADDGGDACDDDDDDDAVVDGEDNCPLVANADQLNTDGDAQGDVCDDDDDDDTVVDGEDNCPLVANTDQANADGDAQGDACDDDDDDDTVADAADDCPLEAGAVENNGCPTETETPDAGMEDTGDMGGGDDEGCGCQLHAQQGRSAPLTLLTAALGALGLLLVRRR